METKTKPIRRPTTEELKKYDECLVDFSDDSFSFEDARLILGSAFSGRSFNSMEGIARWYTKPAYVDSDDKSDEREELVQFSIGFPLYDAMKKNGGTIFGIKDDDSNGSSSVKGAVVMYPFDIQKESRKGLFSSIAKFVNSVRAYMLIKANSSSIPELFSAKERKQDEKAFMKRVDVLNSSTLKWHIQHGPKEPHWYIILVGVHPESHGKGHGKTLMKAVLGCADSRGHSCYLETVGEKNRCFYEKLGFQVVATEKLSAPEVDKDDDVDILLMVRSPKPL